MEKIVCLRGGKFFSTNSKNIGSERYFYKIGNISLQDCILIRKIFIEYLCLNNNLQELHRGWLQPVEVILQLKKYCINNNLLDEKIWNEINAIENTRLEDIHTKIENSGLKFIEMLAKEDLAFYKVKEGMQYFYFFFCLQYMRTKKMKVNIMNGIRKFNVFSNSNDVFNVIALIFATNIGSSLFAEKAIYKFFILQNNTSFSFITVDQP